MAGNTSYLQNSLDFDGVTKKDTVIGNHKFVGTGKMTRVLNDTEVVCSSAAMTLLGSGGALTGLNSSNYRYGIISYIPKDHIPLNSLVSVSARFSAFEIVIEDDGSGTNTTRLFNYSQCVNSTFIRDDGGYITHCGSATHSLITNINIAPINLQRQIDSSIRVHDVALGTFYPVAATGNIIFVVKTPNWYDGTTYPPNAGGVIPNLRWVVDYEYSVISHVSNTDNMYEAPVNYE